jgi:acylphosphatase
MRRVHVDVTGDVQGVFYRAGCAERARALGLAGWVRNVPGGGVEAVFEGPPDRIEEALAWCRSGTPAAVVHDVVVAEESPTGESGFRVVH